MKLSIEPRFLSELKRLPPHRQKSVIRTLEKFQMVPKPRSLDYRSLSGAEGFYIIDANSGDRIILRKVDADHFVVEDTGPHDNVYRRWNR